MKPLTQLESLLLGWHKQLPHLPENARKWLGNNIWWIVVVALVLVGIAALSVLFGTLFKTAVSVVYVLPTVAAWQMVTGTVTLAFLVVDALLLGLAIKPLQVKQKKGWVYLYLLWLVAVLYVVVGAVLTLDPFLFIVEILFGAIWIALTGYFLLEIHGQFGRVHKSPGVKAEAKKKV